jgi:CP family cyanate transporter-like MFS transporter
VFSLALTVIALRARTGADTARLSGMAQGFGYLFAALGPFLFGLLHGLAGGWTVPLAMLLGLLLVQMVFGALAGRHRFVES